MVHDQFKVMFAPADGGPLGALERVAAGAATGASLAMAPPWPGPTLATTTNHPHKHTHLVRLQPEKLELDIYSAFTVTDRSRPTVGWKFGHRQQLKHLVGATVRLD